MLNRALRALSDEAKIIWAGMIDKVDDPFPIS